MEDNTFAILALILLVCIGFIYYGFKTKNPPGCSLVIALFCIAAIIGGLMIRHDESKTQIYTTPSFSGSSSAGNSEKPISSSEFGTPVSTSNIYFFYATGAAKDYISEKLKHPASSDFLPESQMKVYKATNYTNRYTVVGSVDAANSFNAKERKYFQVTMQITEKSNSQYSYSVVNYEIY